jgi:hypothetical protein
MKIFLSHKWPVEADRKSKSTTIFQFLKKYLLRKSLPCVSCGKLAITPAQQQQKKQHDNEKRKPGIESTAAPRDRGD